MKQISTLLLFLIISVALASAQSSEEREVAAAVESLRKAMIDPDKAALENLSAEELTYGHSSGTIEDKAAFVEAITGAKNDYKMIELSAQSIKIVGNTAIVRHKFNAEVVSNGATTTANLGVLQIWQKQNGKWKLLARQGFKL